MFKTITSRYAGTCKRCKQNFEAGTKIRYGGFGRTYHLSKDCPASTEAGAEAQEWRQRRLNEGPLPEGACTSCDGEGRIGAGQCADCQGTGKAPAPVSAAA
jgi:DnaJ-class molecular chaperone